MKNLIFKWANWIIGCLEGVPVMRIIKYGFHGEDDAQNIFLKSHFEWYF
jgi:hypothetical protein